MKQGTDESKGASRYHTAMATNLHVDLVSAKHDRDVLANALEITMPVGDVLVGDTRSHVEHDDTTLSLDVVTVSESTELLLASGIPNVEADRAEVGGESEGVDLHTESGCKRAKRDRS